MKNLLEAAEDYTKQAGWRDLAELKCCMCALGLLLGLAVPRRWRKKAGRGAAVLFAATCIPQAAKFPALAVRRSWRGKCSRRPCLLPVRARRAQTGRKCPPMLALWTLRRCAGIIRP